MPQWNMTLTVLLFGIANILCAANPSVTVRFPDTDDTEIDNDAKKTAEDSTSGDVGASNIKSQPYSLGKLGVNYNLRGGEPYIQCETWTDNSAATTKDCLADKEAAKFMTQNLGCMGAFRIKNPERFKGENTTGLILDEEDYERKLGGCWVGGSHQHVQCLHEDKCIATIQDGFDSHVLLAFCCCKSHRCNTKITVMFPAAEGTVIDYDSLPYHDFSDRPTNVQAESENQENKNKDESVVSVEETTTLGPQEIDNSPINTNYVTETSPLVSTSTSFSFWIWIFLAILVLLTLFFYILRLTQAKKWRRLPSGDEKRLFTENGKMTRTDNK